MPLIGAQDSRSSSGAFHSRSATENPESEGSLPCAAPQVLTPVILMLADGVVLGALPELVQSEVGHLQHPAGGDDAVGRLEVAVAHQGGTVYENHCLYQVVHQRRFEHHVQLNVFVFYNVLFITNTTINSIADGTLLGLPSADRNRHLRKDFPWRNSR